MRSIASTARNSCPPATTEKVERRASQRNRSPHHAIGSGTIAPAHWQTGAPAHRILAALHPACYCTPPRREYAPLAQLDRALDYESRGRLFESARERFLFPCLANLRQPTFPRDPQNARVLVAGSVSALACCKGRWRVAGAERGARGPVRTESEPASAPTKGAVSTEGHRGYMPLPFHVRKR